MKVRLESLFSEVISGEWGEEDVEDNGVNIIRTTNFSNRDFVNFNKIEKRVVLKKIKNDGVEKWVVDEEKIAQKKLLDGDIIIEKSGGGPDNPVGRVVYFINPDGNTYLSNNFTQTLRVDQNKAFPKYLFYNLKYLYQKRVVLKYQNQTTGLFNLKLERYLKEEISLPSLDKQYSIVTQLDTLRSLIDQRLESITVLDDLIKSIFTSFFGNPITNPKEWKCKKLSQLGTWNSGGTPKTSVISFYNGSIPWFSSGELGSIFIEKSNKKITTDAILQSNAKIIPPGSIMIGMYDSAAFKMSINKIECACNQAVIYSKLKDDFYTLFVYFALLLSKDYYLKRRKGARQKNLNATFFKKIEVIYPETEEGKKLINKFYKIFEIYQEKKEKLSQSLDKLILLNGSLLQNTFKNRGVINEEPIFSELLKKMSLKDLRRDKKRLQYLINLFNESKFDDDLSYSKAKEMLFDLMSTNEISQNFNNDKIELTIE